MGLDTGPLKNKQYCILRFVGCEPLLSIPCERGERGDEKDSFSFLLYLQCPAGGREEEEDGGREKIQEYDPPLKIGKNFDFEKVKEDLFRRPIWQKKVIKFLTGRRYAIMQRKFRPWRIWGNRVWKNDFYLKKNWNQTEKPIWITIRGKNCKKKKNIVSFANIGTKKRRNFFKKN